MRHAANAIAATTHQPAHPQERRDRHAIAKTASANTATANPEAVTSKDVAKVAANKKASS